MMYYLHKDAYETKLKGFTKTDGTVVPDRVCTIEERAVYKHHDFSRFYRGDFHGLDGRYQGMKVYTCKTLKKILQLRQDMYDYCGEWFDVCDENGNVVPIPA